MDKKLAATLTIAIFILSTVAIAIPPASAHFTLGHLTGSSRFRTDDFDPHIAGVTGYVWPGGGSAAWSGTPGGAFPSPGYQSPYPGGNPPGAPSSSWYQLESNAYAPFGAILTSTADHPNVGDLIFALNFTCPVDGCPTSGFVNFTRVYLYIPPEFSKPVRYQVTTTVSNAYGDIRVYTAGFNDPYGPGWNYLRISGVFNFTAAHGFKEWYYIRVNGIQAPTIAGRYFFKLIVRPADSYNTYPVQFDAPQCFATTLNAGYSCVPVQNWPVLLVKGEIDPAIIDGTLRYAGTNTTLYGKAINLAGRVRAVGKALDPYTGKETGRDVEARGYFNATAQGHYEIEGVAPGIYTIYAEAAGFPEQVIADNVTVLAGQSLHFDGLINPGPVIHGQVFSKHNFGEEPWTRVAPIRIEILDTDGNVVAESPWNRTDMPWGQYDYAGTGSTYGGARMSYDYIEGVGPNPQRVAFDWEYALSLGGNYYTNTVNGVTCGNGAASAWSDPCRRADGVGPAQYWWVDPAGTYTNGGGTGSFVYQFGWKSFGAALYGAPRDFDGHVPQALATYINGLTAGRYSVRAYVNGYVQTTLDGRTFQSYFFDVAKDEWSGDISVPLDLLKSSYITKTVHFHDLPGSLIANPVLTTRYVLVEVWDVSSDLTAPKIAGWNETVVQAGETDVSLNVTGFGLHGFTPTSDIVDPSGKGHNLLADAPIRVSSYGWQGPPYEDYGLPAGTYEVRTFVKGYIQQTFERTTITLSNSPALVSDHMWKGAHFNITAFSTDWERPRVERPWVWDGESIYVYFTNSKGVVSGATAVGTQDSTMTNALMGCSATCVAEPYYEGDDFWEGWLDAVNFNQGVEQAAAGGGGGEPYLPTAFETDTYSIWGYTYGYVQKKPFTLYAQKGNSTADIKLNLVIGANITLDLKFKHEEIFSAVPNNMSMRIRVFNEKGEVVAADIAQNIPAGTTDLHWVLGGMPDGYHDPAHAVLTTAYPGPDGTPAAMDGSDYPYGIDAYPNYQGTWTIEADTMYIYSPTVWYPPVGGLLQGESFHTIPGHPNGLFGYTGDSLVANHLGPYEQRMVWSVPNAHLGGEASVAYELDERAFLAGQINAFTWSGELRPVSFATLQIAGANGFSENQYTWDGQYETFLNPGDYNFTISVWAPTNVGYTALSVPVHASDGQVSTAMNFGPLERSNIPIPEFTGLAVVAFSALAASVYLLRRRRR